MSQTSGDAYLEHVAINVSNIDWYIDFFYHVFGFTERKRTTSPKLQIWLYGGIQLIFNADLKKQSTTPAHLGIMVKNQQSVLKKISQYDVHTLPKGPNWVQLPDGLQLEIIQANPESIEQVLSITPWRK